MPKLPIISGREACKRFAKIGYRRVRQRGSHMRLIHTTNSARTPLTIPNHPELGKGLLRKLIRDAEITLEKFMEL